MNTSDNISLTCTFCTAKYCSFYKFDSSFLMLASVKNAKIRFF